MKKTKITLSFKGTSCRYCKMSLNRLEEQKLGSLPDLEVYSPLTLDADIFLFDFRDACVKKESGDEDNIKTLINVQKQLKHALKATEELTKILTKNSDKNFHMTEDTGYLMMHGDVSIVKELVEKQLVTIWCRENE